MTLQNVPVTCVPTGVKHLHHAALDYDIGVYFEANGHGTVVFSDKAMETIRNTAAKSNSAEAQKLAALVDVINQVRGVKLFVQRIYFLNPVVWSSESCIF